MCVCVGPGWGWVVSKDEKEKGGKEEKRNRGKRIREKRDDRNGRDDINVSSVLGTVPKDWS